MRKVRSTVKPYEGNDPYIYFSFSQKDAAIAEPIIESMANSGYRVWYDDGGIPNTIWLETVTERLSNCRVCMALISKASADTHACRNDINMALELGVLLVPFLKEDFSLTPAMRLLLEKIPHVKAYTFALTTSKGMEGLLAAALKPTECGLCRQASFQDKPLSVIPVDEANIAKSVLEKAKPIVSIRVDPVLPNVTVQLQEFIERPEEKVLPMPTEEDRSEQRSEDIELTLSENGRDAFANDSEQRKASIETPSHVESKDKHSRAETCSEGKQNDSTVVIRPKDIRDDVLIDLSQGRVLRLREGVIRLGRAKSNDFCFDNKSVSAKHAQIFVDGNGKVMVKDVGSTNGTYIDDIKIDAETSQEVGNFSIVTLSDCCHLLYLDGGSAQDILQLGYCGFLVCEENGEIMAIHPGFILGRENPWPSGIFSEVCISHKHGVFQADRTGYRFLVSQSINGTTVNGKTMSAGTDTGVLKTGDEIGIAGKYRIKYNVVNLRGE